MAVQPTAAEDVLGLLAPGAGVYLAQHLRSLPAHRGDRRKERVRAPIILTEDRPLWVNGQPPKGQAVLDTGAIPCLVGKP